MRTRVRDPDMETASSLRVGHASIRSSRCPAGPIVGSSRAAGARCTGGTAVDPAGVLPSMTLDEAIAAVEATLDSAHLRVDRRLAREDAETFLLLVLDVSNGRQDGEISNGPRVVDKSTGAVSRLTIPAALAQSERMTIVRPGNGD